MLMPRQVALSLQKIVHLIDLLEILETSGLLQLFPRLKFLVIFFTISKADLN